jgi:hypothetical protein
MALIWWVQLVPAACALCCSFGCCAYVGWRRNELRSSRRFVIETQLQNVRNGVPYKLPGGGQPGVPGTFVNPTLGIHGGGGTLVFPCAGGPAQANVVGTQGYGLHGQGCGGEKCPILPVTGEISYRCFSGCQKYF